jgi:hypothetical protein
VGSEFSCRSIRPNLTSLTRYYHVLAFCCCCTICRSLRFLQETGQTGLHIAASLGHDVIIRELMARKASANLKDKVEPPEHCSSSRYLLCCGCTPVALMMTAAVQDGSTALHLAAANGSAAVVKHLLENGADPTIQDLVITCATHMSFQQPTTHASSTCQQHMPAAVLSRPVCC